MKKILVLFLLLFSVQAQAAGIYTTVARGTVTQANMKISAVDGTAFVDFSAADVLTTKLGHLLVIRDSSGRAIQGFIKAAGTGETLSADLLSGWDLTSGWTTVDAVINDANTFTVTVVGGVYKSSAITEYKLYKVVFNRTTTSTVCDVYAGNSPSTRAKFGTGSGTYYANAGINTTLYIRADDPGVTDVNTLELYNVTAPSATGVTIVSTKGGTTYNWAQKNSSFNYNDASGYTYEIYKVLNAPSVSTNTGLTAANEHLATVDGGAFYFGSIDLTNYQDGRHFLWLKDTSGYVAFARIKAETPAGETLVDLIGGTDPALRNGDFSLGDTIWVKGTNVTISGGVANSNQSAAGNIVTNQALTSSVGKLYKYSFDMTRTSGSVRILIGGYGENTYTSDVYSTSGTKSSYGCAGIAVSNTIFYIYATVAYVGTIDNVVVQQVTNPPATGALLENMAGTRNMIYKHPSFNPNAIANIQILYVGD